MALEIQTPAARTATHLQQLSGVQGTKSKTILVEPPAGTTGASFCMVKVVGSCRFMLGQVGGLAELLELFPHFQVTPACHQHLDVSLCLSENLRP